MALFQSKDNFGTLYCWFGYHGFGIAGLMVPTFIDSICSAIAAGFPDDLSTYGVICGLWSSSFALGAFVGLSVSGYLFDVVGFEYGTFFVMSILFLLFIVIICFIAMEKKIYISPELDYLALYQRAAQRGRIFKTKSKYLRRKYHSKRKAYTQYGTMNYIETSA